jgi:hypothetical protein
MVHWSVSPVRVVSPGVRLSPQVIRHELSVVLQPEHQTIQVTDSITLPETLPRLAQNHGILFCMLVSLPYH